MYKKVFLSFLLGGLFAAGADYTRTEHWIWIVAGYAYGFVIMEYFE